ncbi:hypothetical protein TSUD_193690 [Trifolium subterraneum]|uniref:Uncharacterized protein n=1 Tax=Trifolium subterraneum TaxID=3900 RepID=A0A2Z6LRH2_TRISU|nr:hypothetical protein TSUD_193690 [Trifolium subterraneum]
MYVVMQIETRWDRLQCWCGFYGNNQNEGGQQLVVKALCLSIEWAAVLVLCDSSNQSAQLQQTLQWNKPVQGWFKCNSDVGFYCELVDKCQMVC